MRVIERRIARLEAAQRRVRESGPSIAEIIRERRRKRKAESGEPPEPERPPGPLFDSTGRRLNIGETIRALRFGRKTESA
jgi:hypothetical protein